MILLKHKNNVRRVCSSVEDYLNEFYLDLATKRVYLHNHIFKEIVNSTCGEYKSIYFRAEVLKMLGNRWIVEADTNPSRTYGYWMKKK